MQVTEGRVRAGEASGGENLCFFQRSAQFFPLQHQPLQFLLRVGQSLGLPLSFLQADESLQRSFALSDSGFGSGYVFFDFMKPFLHLLAADRVQAFCLCFRGGLGSQLITVCWLYGFRLAGASHVVERGWLFTLLAPEIIFVIARKNFDLPLANFEDAGRKLVDEISIVRNKHDGPRVLHERFEKNIFGSQVEVIRWFIKQQKVRWMQQQT